MDSAVLVLSYSVIAFVLSDLVLARIGLRDTATNERPAARLPRLVAHAGIAGSVLLPVALIFGLRGFAFALTVAVGLLLIDGAAVILDERLDERPASPRATGRPDQLDVSPGWVPLRTTALVLRVLGHAAVLAVAWWIWLAGANESVAGWIASFAGARDAAFATQVLSGFAIMAALVLVNAYLGSPDSCSASCRHSPTPRTRVRPVWCARQTRCRRSSASWSGSSWPCSWSDTEKRQRRSCWQRCVRQLEVRAAHGLPVIVQTPGT